MKKVILIVLLTFGFTQSAFAELCDYRPSKLLGDSTTDVAIGAGGTAAAGVGMKAAGFYTLTNAANGATMLGLKAAGANAAGIVGILPYTSGIVGTIGATLMSPFVIIPAAVTAVGIGVLEGGCYYSEN